MRRAILGDVEIDIVGNENIIDSAEVTDYQVEDGSTFTDHHSMKPLVMTITGVFASQESSEKLSTIRRYQRESEILTYVGRNIIDNAVIITIDRNHSGDNKFGFAYDITLQRIGTQSAERVQIKVSNPSVPKPSKAKKKPDTKKKTKKKTNKGRKQPAKIISNADASTRIKAYKKGGK